MGMINKSAVNATHGNFSIANYNGGITIRTVDIFTALYIALRIIAFLAITAALLTAILSSTLCTRETTLFSVIKDRAVSAS
jgi:hypothetical protein